MPQKPLDLTALKAELANNNSVDASAAAALSAFAADVEAANAISAAEVQAVVDEWKSSTEALATAVANVTGGAPPPSARGGNR